MNKRMVGVAMSVVIYWAIFILLLFVSTKMSGDTHTDTVIAAWSFWLAGMVQSSRLEDLL